ncbi:alkyl sulfatase C-terminal domain-containing protein [Nocardia sp. NPDC056000]|uniref:alkyl sulfatase C-terminal domain-containing protein n=1 Tax=Nocardia sp. NPDC056000 TaxID=3345674 RepID=UPI0035E2CBE5
MKNSNIGARDQRNESPCAQELFEVTEHVFQVRNSEWSGMSLIEGDRGIIVVDPLTSADSTRDVVSLYRRYRGQRPITGLIHTGAIDETRPIPGDEYQDPEIPVLTWQEPPLTTGPTITVTGAAQEEEIDGVRILCQLPTAADAPRGMNFLLPDFRALHLAETATTGPSHRTHGHILTADTRGRVHDLDEALTLFADRTDVAFAAGIRPVWGGDRISDLLAQYRDLHAYLHDQTVRLMGQGLNAAQIAVELALPAPLAETWSRRLHHGTLADTVEAIVQRYRSSRNDPGELADGDESHWAETTSTDAIVHALAIRVDGPRAAESGFTMDWRLTDENQTVRLTLCHGALTHRHSAIDAPPPEKADLTLTLTKHLLLTMLRGEGINGVDIDGDLQVLGRLLRVLAPAEPTFASVGR